VTRSSGARDGRAQSDVVYLDAPEPTARFLDALAGIGELAVDTEGASFHRFVDRVYLLQLTSRRGSAIVDPLSAGELPALGRLLEDPQVEVIFHDADYDLRLLHQDYGWRVRRIFDTRIAAQLLGIRAFGLAALLEREFGLKLDKKHQRADWSMRPLTADMLDYAAQDTKWLLDLRDRLKEQLVRKERWGWASEEFARLEGTQWAPEEADAAFMRLKGARDLTRRELALLRELVQWRDGVARELDRATFRVAGNEVLLEIARQAPTTREALSAIKGVPRGSLESRGADMLAAVQRGLAVPDAELPRFPRAPRWDRDPDFDARVSRLKTVRDGAAGSLDLDPGVLCSRERLEAVARRRPTTREELEELPGLRRWQIEVLGDRFLQALREGAGPAAVAGAPVAAPPVAAPAAAAPAAPLAERPPGARAGRRSAAGAAADDESPYRDDA
jgi:ribonuclease D